ncbi:MAG: molecular chaperone HtpG, partial [Pseudomonadota bacterium]
DACDKLRYEAIQDENLIKDDPDLKIRLAFDPEVRTVTVTDNGVGMTKEELIENLGTIAHSGTSRLVEQLKDSKGDKEKLSLIGQFGVGFYSAFMVADKVIVKTRKAGGDKAYEWVSDGRGSYTIDETLMDHRGTEIVLHLKDDAGEFLLEERLKQVVKKYSDHISFPIVLGEGEDAPQLNSGSALWMRPKSEITEQQYTEFYHHVSSGGMAIDEPLYRLHWKAEGAIEYTNLLFIPGMKPYDLYDPKRHHGVKLYVKRVYITDGVEGLVPPFLRFIRGVVDSEDLPLNISREMLQLNPVVAKIGSAITKRVLGDLKNMAQDNPALFADIWAQYGPVIKEGLYDASQYRDQLNEVVRFHSTRGDDLVSFQDYIDNMKEGQEHIYYLSAADLDTAKNSPQLEGFRAKGIEVLFMTDTIDEFWIPIANDFQGKSFKSVTRGAAELSKIKSDEKEDSKDEKADEDQPDISGLLAKLKTILGEEIKDVTLSERLTDSPVCLVADEGGADMHIERMLKKSQGYEELSKRVLEVNAKHPVILKLQDMVANDDQDSIDDAAWLLLDQARIIEGEPLPDPAGFARRMAKMMELGLIKAV